MKTIQKQIKERAEAQYPQDESINRRMNNRIIESLRDAYQQGVESMLPTLKDVVNKYIAWLDYSCHIHGDIVHFVGESTGLDTYTFFIENIYKP